MQIVVNLAVCLHSIVEAGFGAYSAVQEGQGTADDAGDTENTEAASATGKDGDKQISTTDDQDQLHENPIYRQSIVADNDEQTNAGEETSAVADKVCHSVST